MRCVQQIEKEEEEKGGRLEFARIRVRSWTKREAEKVQIFKCNKRG